MDRTTMEKGLGEDTLFDVGSLYHWSYDHYVRNYASFFAERPLATGESPTYGKTSEVSCFLYCYEIR